MYGLSDHDLMFSKEAEKENAEPEETEFIQQRVRMLQRVKINFGRPLGNFSLFLYITSIQETLENF